MNSQERKWMLQGMIDELLMQGARRDPGLARRQAVVFVKDEQGQERFYLSFRGGSPTEEEVRDLDYLIAGMDLEVDWDVFSSSSRIELRERTRFYPKSHQQPGARTVDRGSTKHSPLYEKKHNRRNKK